MPEAVPVVLANRYVRFLATPDQLIRLKRYFRFHRPGYEFTPSYEAWVAAGHPENPPFGLWDGYVQMMRQGRVATGLFFDQYKAIKAAGEFCFRIERDDRVRPQFLTLGEYNPRLKELVAGEYAFQADCVEAMIKAGRIGGIILNATGTGKTNIAGLFFARLQGSGCFVVDELTLMDQAGRGLGAVLQQERIGRFGGGFKDLQRITVATAQTLQNYLDDPAYKKWFQSQEVVILDELHVMLNERSEKIVRAINPKAVFGLTATLELDQPHVRMPATALTGPPIFAYPLKKGVEAGVLSRSIVVLLEFPASRIEPMFNRARNTCVEELCRASLQLGFTTVVLVRRRTHLRLLSERVQDLKHKSLCGLNSKSERVAAQQAMESGELKLIIASEIFAKGVNIKAVDLIIDATGAPSKNAAAQRHGRGTRRLEGKQGLVYIDVHDWDREKSGRKSDWNNLMSASSSRAESLRALQVPIIRIIWVRGQAKTILQKAAGVLKQNEHHTRVAP